jgi:hypothetical protein
MGVVQFVLAVSPGEANKAACTCAHKSLSLSATLSSFGVCPEYLNEVVHSQTVVSLEQNR